MDRSLEGPAGALILLLVAACSGEGGAERISMISVLESPKVST